MKQGKLNLLIDMQFGSTGKGLLSSYLALFEHADMVVSNLSPNAGHTFEYNDGMAVSRQIPIFCILNKRCGAYLTAGSIINPKMLLDEMKEFDIHEDKIFIHPRAAIITDDDIIAEMSKGSSVQKIASTMTGVGYALANKIRRSAKLAKDCPELKQYVRELDLTQLMDDGCTLFMESCQGFDLSLNSGLSYPHCTSREVTVTSLLNDAQVHPSYLGDVYGCMRSYPIRVGNIIEDGKEIGFSGPFYDDSKELTWDELGQQKEYTTCTNRVRRIATFSKTQYKKSLKQLRPDYIFLNFMNYVDDNYKQYLDDIFKDTRYPDMYGYGPTIDSIQCHMKAGR